MWSVAVIVWGRRCNMTGAPEFSRLINVDELTRDRTEIDLAADEREREALAARFSLPSIEALEARLLITRPNNAGPIRLDARLKADITQSCVVTLEPVVSQIACDFSCTFTADSDEAESPVLDIDPEEADPPEILTNGEFDAGELVAEYFGLEIDPFPRAQNADFEDLVKSGKVNQDTKANPFSVLKDLGGGKK